MDRRAVLQTLLAGTATVATGMPTGASPSPGGPNASPGEGYPGAEAEGYAPLGRVDLPQAAEAVVDDAGAYAYVATLQGFAVVNIEDPRSPRVVAQRTSLLADFDGGPLEGVADLRFDDGKLLVGGPFNGAGQLRGFALYDVTRPEDPTRILAQETAGNHHNLAYADGFAYVSRRGASAPEMVVYDLRGDRATERGSWDLTAADPEYGELEHPPIFIHDLWAVDGVAYLAYWDAGTFIVDVSDPDQPSFRGWVPGLTPQEIREDETAVQVGELPGNHHFVTVNGDSSLLAVGKEAWDQSQTERVGGPDGVELWDISDPAAPTQLSTIDPPPGQQPGFELPETTAHNCDIHGDRLYTSWYNGGVKIHDISNPLEPTELAWWRMPEQTSFWTAQYATEQAFVASSTSIGGRSDQAALFTFPNEPGEQENPPQLGETPSPTPGERDASATPTTGTATPTPTPAGASPTASPGKTTPPETTSTASPGFGIAVGLSALSLAGWRWVTRFRDD